MAALMMTSPLDDDHDAAAAAAADDGGSLLEPMASRSRSSSPPEMKYNTDADTDFVRIYINGRGNPRLYYNGYSYGCCATNRRTRNWRCASHHTRKCRARATSYRENGQQLVRINVCQHNHPTPPLLVPEGRFKELIRVCGTDR